MAKQNKLAKPVTVELGLPGAAEVVLGKVKEEVGHLEGRIVNGFMFYPGNGSVVREKRLEWVVRAGSGGSLTIRASSEKAGKAEVTLGLAGL